MQKPSMKIRLQNKNSRTVSWQAFRFHREIIEQSVQRARKGKYERLFFLDNTKEHRFLSILNLFRSYPENLYVVQARIAFIY